jgi:uncharacterized protein YcnI
MPREPRTHRVRHLAAVGAGVLVTAAAVLIASPAQAHVTVEADDARQGASDSLLTFRVPNEEAAASTVKVTISFPKATPLPSVKPATKPGWTFATTKTTFNPPITTDDGTITDGVSQVVYTAAGGSGTPPGGFDSFQVLVGPLPEKATSLAFPTVQTYSNGTSVAWIQPVTDPADEPDAPVPTLALTAKGAAGSATAADGTGAGGSPGSPAGSGTRYATAADVSGARTLGVAGLVVGTLGLIAGVGGVVLGRRSRSQE